MALCFEEPVLIAFWSGEFRDAIILAIMRQCWMHISLHYAGDLSSVSTFDFASNEEDFWYHSTATDTLTLGIHVFMGHFTAILSTIVKT